MSSKVNPALRLDRIATIVDEMGGVLSLERHDEEGRQRQIDQLRGYQAELAELADDEVRERRKAAKE